MKQERSADTPVRIKKMPNVACGQECPRSVSLRYPAKYPAKLRDSRHANAGNRDSCHFICQNGNNRDLEQSNESGQLVAGENDLLEIVLHPADPVATGSKYTLTIPDHLRVWTKNDTTGTVVVSGTTEFDADKNEDIKLYVEGIAEGSDSIKLNWKNEDGTIIINDCDEVKVTTFDWSGPLNVPGYSIYQYKVVDNEGNLPETSKWIAPFYGTINTGENSSNVTILWNEGPEVGKAIYQVNTDYVWELEVNVVQVKLKPNTGNSISYQQKPTQPEPITTPNFIRSTTRNYQLVLTTMIANLTLDTLKGPVVEGDEDGVSRGVRKIEMGFIQNVKFTNLHAEFDGFSPIKKRIYFMQDDEFYVDGSPDPNIGTLPWYDYLGKTLLDHTAKGYYSSNETDNPDAAYESDNPEHDDIIFKIGDSPAVYPVDVMELPDPDPPYAPKPVTYFVINLDFNLYFAVRTTDTANGADLIYTQRAYADWHFDGSGEVDENGIWKHHLDDGDAFNSNTGSEEFKFDDTGLVVPITEGPWALEKMNDSEFIPKWETKP